MEIRKWPRTDIGTVIIHWTQVVVLFWLIATGLRIASDEPFLRWLSVLDPVLPSHHLWRDHLIGGAVFSAAAMAYAVYLSLAGLSPRIRLDRARLAGLFGTLRQRVQAINAVLLWLFFAGAMALIVSGWFLVFVGDDPMMTRIHLIALVPVVGFVPVHLGIQFAIGGIGQLTRVLRPAPLVQPEAPIDLAALVGELLEAQETYRLIANRRGTGKSEPKGTGHG